MNPLQHKPIDQITEKDLSELVENSVRESKTLEFKRELPAKTDRDRREFLADISSFANCAGGDLAYGIEEGEKGSDREGVATKIVGVTGFTVEQVRACYSSLIRDGLAPRIKEVLDPSDPAGHRRHGFCVSNRAELGGSSRGNVP